MRFPSTIKSNDISDERRQKHNKMCVRAKALAANELRVNEVKNKYPFPVKYVTIIQTAPKSEASTKT